MKGWAARYGLYLILLVGFLLRVAVIAPDTAISTARDDSEYFTLAQNMFADPAHYSNTFRPPLYPAFVALVWKFGGTAWFPIGWMQGLLGTATIALIYGIRRALFRQRRTAVLAVHSLYTLRFILDSFSRSLSNTNARCFCALCGLWSGPARSGGEPDRPRTPRVFFMAFVHSRIDCSSRLVKYAGCDAPMIAIRLHIR